MRAIQKLKIYQSLWAMELRSPHAPERTHAECFRKVAEAGFDGMCLDPSVSEIPGMRALRSLYKEFGLGCMINAFPASEDDMAPLLDFAVEMDACMVNVISGVMPIRPEDAVPVVQRWMREAQQRDMPLLFETHRDSLLNDLYYTLQLMELVPDMRLCADLSHFVVDREMRNPISVRDQQYVSSILARSDCFQGRVASREQVQIQINFPQHQEWVKIFKGWWREGMQGWRARSADDAELVFLCELGPPPYAITDGEQRELSDRWDEALQIRQWVEDIWAE
ncbi:MAG: sugar phosphate isomerase/epimerase [Proteobacteria bacterium]|nr:sugar phosphate isomerase/epimerase [Pseudomonadota bacterium]MDA1062756.1 sugar phosphate isomerase/epimerase [Pseudomonadota bacterium]